MSDELFDIGLQAVSLLTDLPDPIITVSGADSYTVDNTAEYPVLGLSIHGKSTQDGTPTPENPVDIVSVGDNGNVDITVNNGDKSVVASITSSLPLCGIPVSSGGNYTDINGQQWICDELIYNADGTGKIVKRIAKYIFTGAESNGSWYLNSTNNSNKKRFMFTFFSSQASLIPLHDSSIYTGSDPSRIICERYQAVSNLDTYKCVSGISVSHSSDNGYIAIYNEEYSTLTLDTWKSYLAENPITVVYQLNTPQEIELTAAEMAELKELQSFDSVTNIYNNSGADMTVKLLRRDFDMQYVFWIEESQTWTCPIGGKWKIICVGGGASGGQQYGTGAILYGAGGTTSFGSVISAEGGAAADRLPEKIAYGQGGYDGVSYGWAPGSSVIGAGANSQAHGYGGGGYAVQTSLSVTGPSGTQDTKVASGLCGKIKSTIVDLAESQSIICTIGEGGVLNITDSELKEYLMAANTSITAVATTATEFNAAAGKGKKGLIIAQYLGY